MHVLSDIFPGGFYVGTLVLRFLEIQGRVQQIQDQRMLLLISPMRGRSHLDCNILVRYGV